MCRITTSAVVSMLALAVLGVEQIPQQKDYGSLVYAAAVVANAESAETLRVVQWNIGHFAMGKSFNPNIAPERSEARAAEYRAKIAELDADFLGVSEYDPIFDNAEICGKSVGTYHAKKCEAIGARVQDNAIDPLDPMISYMILYAS